MTAQAVTPNEPTQDMRPLVGRPVSNRGLWLFGGGMVLAAILLFSALEARRTALVSPATIAGREPSGALIAPPPPLAMPGGYGAYDADPLGQAPRMPPEAYRLAPVVPQTVPAAPIVRRPAASSDPDSPNYRYPGQYFEPPPQPQPQLPVVALPAPLPQVAPSSGDRLAGGRVGATRLANPSVTVPQGTVIQAVLETALDSNRPGFARAIVSRDVKSFDGSKVLIPRGSRLFGEYKADLAAGQNRAFINWQKLTRPDGVQIAVESPAADPLGRVGVKGSVNSHFFERFAGAILQSALDVGVNLATRSVSDNSIVIGLPGSTQQLIQPNGQNIRPTLKVKQGSSVSVFVARDLDFSTVQ